MDLEKSFKLNEVDQSSSFSSGGGRLHEEYAERFIDCRFAMSRISTHPDERPLLPAVDEKLLAGLQPPPSPEVLFKAWNQLTAFQRTQVQKEEALYCNEVTAAVKRSSQGEKGQLLLPDLPVGPGMRALARQMEAVASDSTVPPK